MSQTVDFQELMPQDHFQYLRKRVFFFFFLFLILILLLTVINAIKVIKVKQ